MRGLLQSCMRAIKKFLVIVLFALGTRALASAQDKVNFPVGVGTKTVGTNMFWLGTKKGFFDEFGLNVQPVLLRGTAITMQRW